MLTTGILTTAEARSKDSPVVPCGRIWPCGDFGLGFRRKLERALKTSIPVQIHPSGEGIGAWFGLLGVMQEVSVALGLSVLRNSRKPKRARPETYGRNGITGYGRKMVKSGAAILQRDYGRDRLSFLTLTVPELPLQDLREIALSWGGLVSRLMEYLSRQLRAQGLPTNIVGVTELQPKRLADGSLGALHVHLVFVGRHPRSRWVLKPQQIREWWLGALGRVTGCPIVSGSCENLQRVEKDASAYLSKYLSKGSGDVAEYAAIAGWDCVPRQWWNCTATMRKAIKREILSSDVVMGILEGVINMVRGEDSPRGFEHLGQVRIPVPESEETRGVGWFGTLTPDFHRELRELAQLLPGWSAC